VSITAIYRLIVFLVLLFCSGVAEADHTALHTAATALAPGQWSGPISGMTNLTTSASVFNSSAPAPGPGYDAVQPAWDPVTKKLYMELSEHSDNAGRFCPEDFPNYNNGCWKPLLIYDDATSTWTVSALPSLTTPYPHHLDGSPVEGVHTWGFIAYDNVNKVLYVKSHGFEPGPSYGIFRYCLPNSVASYCATQLNDWRQVATPTISQGDIFGLIGWHAGLNGGTLLLFDPQGNSGGCGALFGYREGVGWSTLDSGAGCKYPYGTSTHPPATYSTIKNVAIYGPSGANALQWWRINSSGTVAALDTAPCVFTTTDGGFSQIAEDPTGTGDIIFIGCDVPTVSPGQMWRLNPTGSSGNQWSLIDGNLNAVGKICNVMRQLKCAFDFFVTPISTYGVLGFWKYRSGNFAEYWLYKPSTFVGDTTPPSSVAMTAPSAGATVSGTLTPVTATATDDVGVAGVQFKLDGSNLGTEDTSSPYSIIWDTTGASNGSHTLSAVARDAAGNTATSSGVTVTVSNGGGSDFTTRCNAAGVFFCNGFDAATDLGVESPSGAAARGYSGWNNNACGSITAGGDGTFTNSCPTIDTTTKLSGAGSMHFSSPAGAIGMRGGQYWANPMADYSKRFGAGQTYYVQFRQRLSAALVSQGQDKLHWVSTAADTATTVFGSCSPIELVNQSYASDDSKYLVQNWYSGCPGPYTYGLYSPVIPGTVSFQNQRPSPFCNYDDVSAGRKFPPTGNCLSYFPDQWVTYSYKIGLGTLGTSGNVGNCDAVPSGNYNNCYYNNDIEMRMGLDGEPLETVHIWTRPINAKDATDLAVDYKYGKVIFAIYSNTVAYAQAVDQWVDELIMSDLPIADPGTGGSVPPIAPSGFKLK